LGVIADALLLLLLATGSSHGSSPAVRTAIQEQGGLTVFLMPLPQDASRLRFRWSDLSAVRSDGTLAPLTLELTDVEAPHLKRQRRLAAAALPPGSYTGLSMTIGKASLQGDEGSVVLPIPDEPSRLDFPFKIERKREVVLSLELDYRASIGGGYRFSPVFAAQAPPRPAADLIGVVSSRGSDSVTLFEKTSGLVAGIVPTESRPTGLVLDPAKRRAYVADAGRDTIEVIGLLEQTVLDRLELRGGDEPLELALTPDGRTLLSANSGSNTVSLIDADGLVERTRIQVGSNPTSILVDREGKRAWVFNTAESTLSVIDIGTRAVVGTVSTEASPVRGQFDRAGGVLYVIHKSSPNMVLVDPLSLSVTRRVYVGSGATAIKVDSRTDRIYLAIRGTDEVAIYDRLSLLPADTIPVDGDVLNMAIDEEGYNIYLVIPEAGEIQAVRLVSKETAARIDVGDNPYGVALLGER